MQNLNHEKIAKINGAKDCKFEFGAVQRNANLVDLEKCCKMRLFSLSQLSIQPRTSPLKFGSRPASDPPDRGRINSRGYGKVRPRRHGGLRSGKDHEDQLQDGAPGLQIRISVELELRTFKF